MKTLKSFKASSYRYERKFFINDISRHNVEYFIKIHSALFSEIHHTRCVNNIYFDTHDWACYKANVEGATERIKVRLRWYGALFGYIESPTLEIKIKKGLLGMKKSVSLHSFSLTKDSDLSLLLQSKTDIPESWQCTLQSLHPVLLNRYSRKYFLSFDKRYRATIDTNQHFYKIEKTDNSFSNTYSDLNNTILELKYDKEDDHGADSITTAFPFQLTKSSKYVRGIQNIYTHT